MKKRAAAACVSQWFPQDPTCTRRRSVEEWARFGVLRARLLRHLRRDPRMWLLQGGNILRGLARSALFLGGVLVLAPPVLVFWEPFLWPAADPPPPLPFPAPEGTPTRWTVVVVCLTGLVLLDLLLGQRLSDCRNVFVDKAERLAWAVVDGEPPAAAGPAEPPGSSGEHTKSTMEHEERERC